MLKKKDDENYLTEKECINLINEASLEMYDRLLSEILDEIKKMIEKYHLDEKSESNSEESEKSNDIENNKNSSKKEDEEKEKSMKTENDEKIDVEETPNVQKNLEEL